MCSPFPHGHPLGAAGGRKTALRASQGKMGEQGTGRAGGVKTGKGAQPRRKRGESGPGYAPGGHRKPVCMPFPPGPFLGSHRREKNGPTGLSGKKWENSPGEKPSREPAHGKGNPRRAAAQAGNPRKHGRIGAQRPAGPPSGAGRLPFLPPASRNQPKRAEKGPGRHGAPQRVPVTPQSHAGMVAAARRRERDGRDAPLRAGPGGKNRDTPGPSARRPRAPDGSHHGGRLARRSGRPTGHLITNPGKPARTIRCAAG